MRGPRAGIPRRTQSPEGQHRPLKRVGARKPHTPHTYRACNEHILIEAFGELLTTIVLGERAQRNLQSCPIGSGPPWWSKSGNYNSPALRRHQRWLARPLGDMVDDTARLVVKSRRKEAYIAVACPYTDCRAQIEYKRPKVEDVAALPSSVTSFSVTCVECKRNFDPPGAPRILREIRADAKGGKKEMANKRRIGTDERPLDMT